MAWRSDAAYTGIMGSTLSGGAVIDVRHLRKTFGRTVALADVDLRVQPGEIHAFLGPNGAGKTTTLRLLLGLLRSDGGTMSVLGLDPWRDVAALHRQLAYVPGDVSLWPNLTGGEVIHLLARLRGGVDQQRVDELVQRFDLDPTQKGRSYSKGNRQKVALISALASDVELYLLDEPTSGLDPLKEAEFRECVRDLRDRGSSVLLSSHILSEAEAVSDRVSIIRNGVIVESGSLEHLRRLSRTSVRATLRHRPPALTDMPGVHDLSVSHDSVSAQVEPAAMPGFMAALASAGIAELVSKPPTLEELFLEHYEAGAA